MKKKTKKSFDSHTIQTLPQFCPLCFKVLDAATSLWDEAVPGVGDFTVCINCSGVLRWNETMMLYPAKIEDAPPEIRLKLHKVRAAIIEMRATVGPPKGKEGGRA